MAADVVRNLIADLSEALAVARQLQRDIESNRSPDDLHKLRKYAHGLSRKVENGLHPSGPVSHYIFSLHSGATLEDGTFEGA